MAKKSFSSKPVTKSDLDREIKGLRAEVKRGDKALRQEILRVEEKVENLDEKVEKKFDKVMTMLDGIAKVSTKFPRSFHLAGGLAT